MNKHVLQSRPCTHCGSIMSNCTEIEFNNRHKKCAEQNSIDKVRLSRLREDAILKKLEDDTRQKSYEIAKALMQISLICIKSGEELIPKDCSLLKEEDICLYNYAKRVVLKTKEDEPMRTEEEIKVWMTEFMTNFIMKDDWVTIALGLDYIHVQHNNNSSTANHDSEQKCPSTISNCDIHIINNVNDIAEEKLTNNTRFRKAGPNTLMNQPLEWPSYVPTIMFQMERAMVQHDNTVVAHSAIPTTCSASKG